MDLITLLVIIFVIGPLGLLLIMTAAFGLRDVRPKRARLLIWLCAPLALFVLIPMGFPSTRIDGTSAVPPWLITIVEVGVLTTLAAMVIGAVALLYPMPADRRRPTWFGVIGLVCIATAATAAWTLSQADFTL